jgi:ubiquinone/menaquinone biosynthesis C-methylase UbiE
VNRQPIDLARGAPPDAAGQDAAKYSSTNAVVRWLLARWLRHLRVCLASASGPLVDVGVGEGLALEWVRPPEAHPTIGVDYRLDKLRSARERLEAVSLVCADAAMLPFRDAIAATVVCTEVLEHLTSPMAAATELVRICNGWCVISVPWEPFFRLGNLARGKNFARLGNDPEHVQHYHRRTLQRELRRSFGDVTIQSCFPWLVARCTPHGGSQEVSAKTHRNLSPS